MPDFRKFGATSNIIRLVLKSKTTGQGLQGVSSATTGLVISTITDNEASATAYSGSNIEAVGTLGTFAAPTGGKVRIKKVDDTNNPGLVELQIADARFSVASAKRLVISINDAQSTMLDTDYIVEFTGISDAVPISYTDGVKLADGVAHGGTPGSSTATLGLKSIFVNNTTGYALDIEGLNGSYIYGEDGPALDIECGTGVSAIKIVGDAAGIDINATGAAAPGIYIVSQGDVIYGECADTGHGINLIAAGSGKHDINLAGSGTINGDFAAFTETYAADGAAVKLSQALYEILSFLEERSISGTTMTCKKRDGSTSALTFTLNDATNPTAVTRAT